MHLPHVGDELGHHAHELLVLLSHLHVLVSKVARIVWEGSYNLQVVGSHSFRQGEERRVPNRQPGLCLRNVGSGDLALRTLVIVIISLRG